MNCLVSMAILVAIISAGPILICSISEKKYGEILPISCFSLIIVELIVGVLLNLKIGFFVVLILAAGCYLYSGISLIVKKSFKTVIGRIISPASIFFVCACTLFLYINNGKYFCNWDEFSHWGDVVRAMVYLDDFGTNPDSLCFFKSYPPATSIFQYFAEKIMQYISPGKFNESIVYIAYQILMCSFFLPLVEKVGRKGWISAILSGLVFLILPIMVFTNCYSSIYVDPFLGFLTGIGFATIYYFEEETIYKALLLCSISGTLVISKESGILFSAMIAVAYFANLISKNEKRKLIYAVIPFLGFIVPKLLWEYELKISSVSKEFGNKIDFVELLGAITGTVDNYRTETWRNFFDKFASDGMEWTRAGIKIPFLYLLIIFLCALIITSAIGTKRGVWKKNNIIAINAIVILTIIVFILGTVVSYMFKFSEYEAVRVASFYRYLSTVFLAAFVYAFATIIYLLSYSGRAKELWYAALVLVAVMTVPKYAINTELSRFAVKSSLYGNEEIRKLADYCINISDGDDYFYFIAQEDNGYYRLVFNSLIRPNQCGTSYSIGKPFYEGDIWSTAIDCATWEDDLINNYDYVLLYQLNEYFYEIFAPVFADPDDIEQGGLYKVNKNTKLLERVF